MSKPERAPRHLHIFAVSCLLILVTLVIFLFAVKMEATAPGTGIITSERLLEIRCVSGGVVELPEGTEPIFPGHDVAAGTPILIIRSAEGKREHVIVPDTFARWRVVEKAAVAGQVLTPGSKLFTLVPLEGEQIVGLMLRLEVEEKHFGEIRIGQDVRLESNMYSHRVHGTARGKIDRIEPMGEPGPNNTRRFFAWVRVEHCPFPLLLGSSIKAEVVIGSKRTYQIILEH